MIRSRSRRVGAPPPPAEGRRSNESFLLSVVDGDGLVEELRALPAGPDSPFAVPGTHHGRFALFGRHPGTMMLALSATIDADRSAWLAAFLERLGPTSTDATFSRCAGWPGPEGAVSWIDGHRIPPTLPFATWEAPVDRIQGALARTAAVLRFALDTQTMAPEQRHAEFVARFGLTPAGRPGPEDEVVGP